MTYAAAQSPVSEPHPSLLHRIEDALIACAEGTRRIRSFRTLDQLSDQELAERGLTRDEIVAKVFREGC